MFKDRINWTVSINGSAEKHDESRGVERSYGFAVATIIELKKLTDRVGIAYVPFKENAEDYPWSSASRKWDMTELGVWELSP